MYVCQDAYILATVLSHRSTNRDNIPRALAIYDTIRRPAALHVQEKSRLNGQYFTFLGQDHLDRLPDSQVWEKLQNLGNTFTKNWEWGA